MKPELLAPAGSLEKLKIAVHYGADAVYIGGQKYGLRSNADNFSFDEMHEGVDFAKRYGAKVFTAVNIYAHNEDLSGIESYLNHLADVGISAIIVADPAIIDISLKKVPQLEVHLSTQQSTMNWKAVQFWKNEGIPRVVLARETSMKDIITIKQNVDIEIEAFIHGAMCSSYSGRCVLSNHFTDRDSNRGGCSQSCRWKYDLYADDNLLMPLDENPFTMGSKDLFMLEHIPELIHAGIDSFKIEGRMKSMHYVATIVNAYRQAIDSFFKDPNQYELNPMWLNELNKAANRPLNTGFFYNEPGYQEHIYNFEEKPVDHEFAGIVIDYDAQKQVVSLQQRNYFKLGQEVEFFGPGGTFFIQEVSQMWDDNGHSIAAAKHPMQIIHMKVNHPLKAMDMMRRRKKQIIVEY